MRRRSHLILKKMNFEFSTNEHKTAISKDELHYPLDQLAQNILIGHCNAIGEVSKKIQDLAEKLKKAEKEKDETIKKSLCEKRRAELLVEGDWLINRPPDEISKKTGLITQQKQELFLLKFLEKHNQLEKDEKLVHFHPGCGNGSILKTLRKNSHLFEEKPVSSYFEQIGLSDKFYYTLPDLFHSFLNPEFQENPIVSEFIEILSILILRRVHFDKRFNSQKEDEKTQKTTNLPYEINNLRYILKNLTTYFPRIGRISELNKDGEFIGSAGKKPISEECQKFLRQLNSEEKTTQLWETLFDKDFFNPHEKSEKDLYNLEKKATFYTDGVIIGKFQNINEILKKNPKEKCSFINLVNIHRASSHLDNCDYKKFIKDLSYTLSPGGYIEDDGFRESYTREERISELVALQKELGDEFRIELICDVKGTKTMMLQRAILDQETGEKIFFSKEDKNNLLFKGNFTVPIKEAPVQFNKSYFKSLIIRMLKSYFIDEKTNKERIKRISKKIGKDPQLVYWNEVIKGRLEFEKIHSEVDKYLADFFKNPKSEWNNLENKNLNDNELYKIADCFFDQFIMNIEVVKKRVEEILEKTPTNSD